MTCSYDCGGGPLRPHGPAHAGDEAAVVSWELGAVTVGSTGTLIVDTGADTAGASVAFDPELAAEHAVSASAVRQTIAARMVDHSITAGNAHCDRTCQSRWVEGLYSLAFERQKIVFGAPPPFRNVDSQEAVMTLVTADPILSLDMAARTSGATKIYGRGDNAVRALDGVTIGFPRGQLTAIMGPSGSGKSTLMHCVAGLDSLTSGQAFIGDIELGTLSERELTRVRRDRIGFVFQAYNLIPTLTALENITLPARLAGRQADSSLLDTVIDAVGMRSRLTHRPSELSGGQQQRVAVARALAGRPDIVFADEPTGNLDSKAGAEILSFMRAAVRDFGQTIVMVTHDPVAACSAETIIFLSDGRIVDRMEKPTVATILEHMKTLGG